MITIEFLGPISKKSIQVEASNLKELPDILKQDTQLVEWLNSSAVAVNDTMVNTLDTPLKDGDKISILPPVCGG
jgi:molybdopterin synthase sulfur carrier subunit